MGCIIPKSVCPATKDSCAADYLGLRLERRGGELRAFDGQSRLSDEYFEKMILVGVFELFIRFRKDPDDANHLRAPAHGR